MDIKNTPSWSEYNEAVATHNADPGDADAKAAMMALWDTCLKEQAQGVEAEKTAPSEDPAPPADGPSDDATGDDADDADPGYDAMSKGDLYSLAQDRDIDGRSGMDRDELQAAHEAYDAEDDDDDDE